MVDQIVWKESRSRSLRLTIKGDGLILVSLPRGMERRRALQFIEEKRAWIERSQARLGKKERLCQSSGVTRKEEIVAARARIQERLQYFNRDQRFTIRKVTVRDQKTRWGSCSSRGVLSFQYRLVRLPIPLMDYVIVHELCHLIHMNHGVSFWSEVERILPDYLRLRVELKKYQLEHTAV